MIGKNEKIMCSLIVLNYNGKSLLEEFLPGVISAAKESTYYCEVVVVDNLSTDDSIEFLNNKFSEVNLIRMSQNQLLVSYNDALKQLESPYIILLNNDMRPGPGFVDNIMAHLITDTVFAVSPKIFGIPGNELQYASAYLHVKKWWIALSSGIHDIPGLTMLAHGGASGYNRGIFLLLGGFDKIFLPGYAEDLDLSYRAIKRGYKIMYAPKAVVFHKKGSTMNKYYKNRLVFRISLRNHFLFYWKNITDTDLFVMHFLTLPFRLIINLIRGNTNMIISFFWALKYIPQIYKNRKEIKSSSKYKDREILMAFENIYEKNKKLLTKF